MFDFYDLTHLEARKEIQIYFRSFFGSNENFKICFRDLLTFSMYLATISRMMGKIIDLKKGEEKIIPNLKNVCTYFLSCVVGGFCPAKLFSEAAEAALDSAFKPTTLTK